MLGNMCLGPIKSFGVKLAAHFRERAEKEPAHKLFRKLSPIRAETPELESAFEFVFGESDITNIAVCGAYGSGKSSVMLGALDRQINKHSEERKRFFRSDRELKWLTVSLAHFDSISHDGAKEIGARANETDEELALEARLLSQIVHQIDSPCVKKSRLLKNRATSLRVKVPLFFVLSAFAISILGLTQAVNFSKVFGGVDSSAIYGASAIGLVFSIITILAGCIFGGILPRMFNRLEIPGIGSAEFFHHDKDKEPSTLDKYLDDILYLLKTSKNDVVVFEDLDRWGDTRILEKLRQINILLNASLKPNKAKKIIVQIDAEPIRFFYILKDDIFEPLERVKFFDFLITVHPVSDFNNSSDLLIKRFEEDGLTVSRELIMAISHYVMDNRLLLNIVNEVHQFRSWAQLGDNNEVANDQILSIVTYKNLYPGDYAQLQEGKGYLYTLLHSRRELIESIVSYVLNSDEGVEKEKSIGLRQRLNAQSLGKILREYPGQANDCLARLGLADDTHFAKDLIESQLLRFFVRNDYINEGYWTFIARAHGVRLSSRDSDFVRTVIVGAETDCETELDNVEGVIDSLAASQFSQKGARVYKLAASLLGGDNTDKIDSFFEGLRRDEDTAFVMHFLHSGLCQETALIKIESEYPGSLFLDKDISEINSSELRELIQMVLNATEEISDFDSGLKARTKCLISSDPDFYVAVDPSDDLLFLKMQELGVEMVDLNLAKMSGETALKIVDLGLFCPNEKMVSILSRKLNDIGIESYNELLSAVHSSIDTLLGKRVNEKISRLLGSLLANDQYKPKDSACTVAWVLGHDNIVEEQKREYLSLAPSSDVALAGISNTYWEDLLSNGVADFSMDNIAAYYDDYSEAFDSVLVAFFNKYAKPGVINKCSVGKLQDPTDFVVELAAQKEIERETFEVVFGSFGEIPSDVSLDIFTPNQLSYLFAHSCIEMAKSNLEFVRQNYPEYTNEFILQKTENYLQLVREEAIAPQRAEVLLLLGDSGIRHVEKTELLDYAADCFSVSREYSDELNIYLIRNYFDKDDFERNLGLLYEEAGDELKTVIVDTVASTLNQNYKPIILPHLAITRVLGSEKLANPAKVNLICDCLKDCYGPEDAEVYLRTAGFVVEADLMHGSSRKIYPEKEELELISALQRAGYLGKLTPIPSDPGSYRLYGKKVL